MRILAIGLGGAGCRIVNSLYTTDRRSSKVVCVQALAIDVNADTLAQMGGMPDNAKLFFPPIDLDIQTEENGDDQTATIDIGEIVARIQNIEIGETDAIFVCCGLGGSMVDVAPHIIAALRSSITEPIFGLVTLPCLAEGERRSAKAADDLDMLTPLLDGTILFDNETWYKKTKAQKSTLTKKEKGLAEKLGIRKGEPEISPELATYLLLNEGIVRRISLILRAGEFKADGGLDFAEVVLDSGEVLNTMKGMGYITIGYAVERLPHNPLSFLTSWRPTGFFADEHIKKASRIVDLAKQAIYHEISTPCDMTSAHKALILIAGPSHELSLKGYMTVRKWIDRSIAGVETRSGDYPVMNTKNVAIIIMLSGLENIPRITELKEIQNQYKTRLQEGSAAVKQSGAYTINLSEDTGISSTLGTSTKRGEEKVKGETLILPIKARKIEESSLGDSRRFSDRAEKDYPHELEDSAEVIPPRPSLRREISAEPEVAEKRAAPHPRTKPHIIEEAIPQLPADEGGRQKSTGAHVSRHRVVVAMDNADQTTKSSPRTTSHVSSVHRTPHGKISSYAPDSRGFDEKHLPHSSDERLRTKEMERQIIEKELQRQRMMAISGRTPKTRSDASPHPIPSPEIIRLKREVTDKMSLKKEHEPSDPDEVVHQVHKKRTVIIQKKKVHPMTQDTPIPEDDNRDAFVEDDDLSVIRRPEAYSQQTDSEESKVSIKNSAYKSKDKIFEGKGVQRPAAPQVRDSALIHTDLKSKKTTGESKDVESDPGSSDHVTESSKAPKKREKNTTKKDDISWI
jgi:cell division GTPase FtsZ